MSWPRLLFTTVGSTCCQLLYLRRTFERVFSVCGEQTAGKRNRLTKSLEKRIMLQLYERYKLTN